MAAARGSVPDAGSHTRGRPRAEPLCAALGSTVPRGGGLHTARPRSRSYPDQLHPGTGLGAERAGVGWGGLRAAAGAPRGGRRSCGAGPGSCCGDGEKTHGMSCASPRAASCRGRGGGPRGPGGCGDGQTTPLPTHTPPPALSAPHPRCGCATVGRSWGRREPSAAGRPFRFAHPSWNGRPRPERSGGSAPPCGVTAAGTAGRGAAAVSCVQTPLQSVQTPLRVQTPPALRRRDPPGGGRGSGPVSAPAARGEPRTPPPSGAGSLPGAAGSQPQPPRPPQPPRSPSCTLLPVKLKAIPRGGALKGTFRAKSHFFPPPPLPQRWGRGGTMQLRTER